MGGRRELSASEAKAEIVRLVGVGESIATAVKRVGKSRATYDYYRRSDAKFVEQVERQKVLVARGYRDGPEVEVPDFPEFCERYLGQRLFPHQLQWFDLLEGREPRDVHPSMSFTAGKPQRVIVNTPPGHAKSTTITVNYVVWRIVRNPDVKVIVVSKAQRLAEQFLLQIKERLTSSEYEELQADFGPPGGWKEGSASWKANQFYVGGRGSEAKDPTVQAVGIRGQVYGARADLIVVDDAVDNTNVGDFDKQIDWLLGIVGSRLAPRSGRLLVVGTRIAARDMYSELMEPTRYYGGSSPWTHLQQPAVLEFADDPRDWVTLWPFSDRPADPEEEAGEDGLFTRWDGPTLAEVRNGIAPAQWSRIYQQEQVAEDAVFDAEMVVSACQARPAGAIPDDPRLGREGGMSGLRLIAGLDPATVGHTAAVLVGVCLKSGVRFVVDAHNEAGMSPESMRNLIRGWTERFGVQEWRIERNAFQAFLTRDAELLSWLASRGVTLTEHMTGANKHDEGFGVMAMSALFANDLIKLPNGSSSEAVKSLIEQLVTWSPDAPKKQKTDLVMALWFAELRALELVARVQRSTMYRNNHFITRGDKEGRFVLSANDVDSFAASGSPPRSWWG